MLYDALLGKPKAAADSGHKIHRYEDFFPWWNLTDAPGLSSSGESVTPSSALTLDSYFACIRNASEDLGKTPIRIKKNISEKEFKIDKDHRAYRMMMLEPNPDINPMNFKECLNHLAMGWGAGIAYIERDSSNNPLYLWPIHTSRVQVVRDDSGRLVYDISMNDSATDLPGVVKKKRGQNYVIRFMSRDIFDIHGLGAIGTSGYIMSALARESIGLGLASRKYASRFYKNDATPRTVIMYPKELGPEAIKNFHDKFTQGSSGDNRHKIAIAQDGIKIQQLSVSPEDAQLIELGHYTIESMARWFRMPPHKIQHLLRSTFSNIDAQNIEYVQDCLDSWATRWEEEIVRKLMTPQERIIYEVDFWFKKRLRADPLREAQVNRIQFSIGALKPDEVRSDDGRNPLTDGQGDHTYLPLNMQRTEDYAPPSRTNPDPAKGTGFENTDTGNSDESTRDNPPGDNDDNAANNHCDRSIVNAVSVNPMGYYENANIAGVKADQILDEVKKWKT